MHEYNISTRSSPPSPISMSLKAISDPESLISISPLRVNMMFISVRSIMQPTTSPDSHWRPNGSLPTCQRWAWEGQRSKSSEFGTVQMPNSHIQYVYMQPNKPVLNLFAIHNISVDILTEVQLPLFGLANRFIPLT